MAIHLPKWTARQIFLTDGLGALLSAFMQGVVLLRFEHFFGMPARVLTGLALLACVYAVYSLSLYRLRPRHPRPWLRTLAMANLTFCLMTASLLLLYSSQLTFAGWSYFILEIMVVLVLVRLEWKYQA